MSELRRLILSQRPVRYWPLDEAPQGGAVPTFRELCSADHGTSDGGAPMETSDLRAASGSLTALKDGPDGAGRAVAFDGNDRIALASSGALLAALGAAAGFTIAGWFTYPAGLRWDALYCERSGSGGTNIMKVEVADTNGPLQLIAIDSGGTNRSIVLSGGAFADDRLHFFQIERDAARNRQRAWMDGKQIVDAAHSWGSWDSNPTRCIGGDASDGGASWVGVIAHLCIFDRPLGRDFHLAAWQVGSRGPTRPGAARGPTRLGQ